MNNIPTPHNSAKFVDIAKTVLMPGDPLRAKFIAENFLDDAVCVNRVRNMLCYTGKYKGKTVSIMGSGMGIPSIGIYSYELYNFYGVDNIIRIGSAGGIADDISLKDIVIAMGASTNSNYIKQFRLEGSFAPIASYELLQKAVSIADKKDIDVFVGNVLSNDIFYDNRKDYLNKWKDMGILCVEMETAGLYANAAKAKKNALCILSISDLPFKGESLSSDERRTSFTKMMEIALEMA